MGVIAIRLHSETQVPGFDIVVYSQYYMAVGQGYTACAARDAQGFRESLDMLMKK